MIIEFIKYLFSYQMMPYTVPLFVMLLYWIFFLCGVAGDADGAADGAVDAAADGAVDAAADAAIDGAVDGALDGVADGALDGVADGALEAAQESVSESLVNSVSGLDQAGVLATADAVTEKTAPPKPGLVSNRRPRNLLGKVLTYLHIGEIPATIVFSILISLNWLYGYLGLIWLRHEDFALNFPWTEGILRFALTTAASILTGGLVCRPLSRIFGLATVHVNEHLIGKPCRIKSSKVTANFGEGELTIDGSYIIISIRAKSKNTWQEGELATIIGYDEEKNVYFI